MTPPRSRALAPLLSTVAGSPKWANGGQVGGLDAVALWRPWSDRRFMDGEPGERQCCELFGDFLDAQAALWIVPFVKPVQHPQQPVRGDLNVEVGAEFTDIDTFAKYLLPAMLVFFRREPDHLAKAALYCLSF